MQRLLRRERAWYKRLPFALGLLAACADGGAPARSDAALADAGSEDAAAPAREGGPLINNALWQALDPVEDPFMETPAPLCPKPSYGEEALGGELVFAVRTELCPALTARQLSRREVVAGDTLELRAYHFALTAPENAVAQLVLQLGEREVFRRALPIPSEASELSASWIADESFPRGTPVLFHVQNHGANEYALVSVEVVPP